MNGARSTNGLPSGNGAPAPIVEARDVFRTYDTGKVRVNALNGVTLSVARGEMLAIMGPSGSGKSTLLNCLSGLDEITRGDVLIEGTSLGTMSDRERTDYRARRMGFVFQFYNLIPVLTAVENVELPLLVARVPMNEARVMSWPRIATRPSVGESRAPIMLSSVLFPLPEGPSTTMNSPASTRRSAPSSAVTT